MSDTFLVRSWVSNIIKTRGLVWEIMRVEAQIKWAKVEIQSTATDAALLVNEKDSHLTPKLEKLEQRVEVAEDFLESAKKTPAQFDRTRELLSRPAVVKQFDWMSALGSFLQDVEQFECLARYSIEKVTGRDTVTLVRRERRLRTLREVLFILQLFRPCADMWIHREKKLRSHLVPWMAIQPRSSQTIERDSKSSMKNTAGSKSS